MKIWHILITFIIATVLVIVGALFKVMHWTGASAIMITGMAGQFLGLVFVAAKILSERKNNSFLNK